MENIKRFWEVDLFRGIAIILMIIFNWSFALKYFDIYVVDGGLIYWFMFPRFIAAMFIFLVGLSLVLSYNRIKHKTKKEIYKKYLTRAVKIFILGLGITLVTWTLFPAEFIIFGILHLIGLSIILAVPFLDFKKLNLILGLILIGAGIFLYNFKFVFPSLLWLIPQSFSTFDYFPLLPWFGIVLIGLYFGNVLYKDKRNFKLNDNSRKPVIKHISYLGKHSLILYLVHQPILVAILFTLGFL